MTVPLSVLAPDALLTAVPPALALVALALAVATLPRRSGHAAAVGGGLAVAAWTLAVPAGAHVATPLFGFDAVLFHVDAYSRVLGATLGFAAAFGAAYAYATGGDRRQTAYALAYVGSGAGAALAGDWLSLVVFWELMAVSATVLVWHRTSDRDSATRYAIYHEIGGLALMAGVLLHYAAVGTFLFGDGITGGLPAALIALGIGLNAGFVGLHVWLVDTYPRAHVATSVVLVAVTTKVGVYAFVRAVPDGHVAVAYVGGAMVLVGVTMAVLQTEMRRLLTYHIVSQVGYMVAGFGAGTALAQAGALAHLVNNVLYKGLLFMVAGVVVVRTGEERLKKLGGLGREMPVTAGIFLVAALSIAGLPGTNGFISKGMVLDGVQKAGLDVLWWALVVGGVGTVVSFAKFAYYTFLGDRTRRGLADLSLLELLPMGAIALSCVALGVLPALLFALLPAAGVADAKPFAPSQFLKAGAVTAAGVVGFVAVRKRLPTVTPVGDLDAVYHPLGRRLQRLGVAGTGALEDGLDRLGASAKVGSRRLLGGRLGATGRQSAATTPAIGAGILAIAIVLAVALALLFV